MPKSNFMISRAVDLVARKLAGMDSETVARLTQVLSEEAQMISEELQYSGQNVDADVLAARLEGLVTRMKYEARNQGPDPSPYEFPIFNVSHNPASPYPNPINHLYDKRYKEAYSTFIKQNQEAAASAQKAKASTPALPPPTTPSKPTSSSSSSSHSTNHSQGQYQRQHSNNQAPPSPGFLPAFNQQQMNNWQYMNPYAAMSHSHNGYYQQQQQHQQQQQQGSQLVQPSSSNTQPLHRSATGDDLRSNSLSHSASTNELNYSPKSGKEQIRVRVIDDNSSSSLADLHLDSHSNNRPSAQRSILKSSSKANNDKDTLTTRTIYTSPNTEINKETMEDLLKVVNSQRSEATRSSASPMAERIIIIDRRGASTPDNDSIASGNNRFRTFEIHTTTGGATPSTTAPAVTSPPAAVTPTTSAAYAAQQPTYYPGQQVYYQQPKVYASAPNNMYATTATPYAPRVNAYYPFGYYHY